MLNKMPKHLISINDLTLPQIDLILKTATTLKDNSTPNALSDKIIAACFYEPSTRTRLSFETAALKLGAKIIGFANGSENTSVKKGETLQDSIKIIGQYADLLIIRHALDGAARLASLATDIPVINAGDGSNQHPSQTLLDLYTILESQGRLENLSIAFVGDLKYGRTVHSLLQAASQYRARFYFVSPESLTVPKSLCELLRERGVKFSFHDNIEEILPQVDIVYMTRLQKERFIVSEQSSLFNQCRLTINHLQGKLKPTMRILHPLPRVDELDPLIDETPHAYYFQQAKNGTYVRQALLSLLLAPRED
jgi:aspartate carbamoyltransferase catalytic subunit